MTKKELYTQISMDLRKIHNAKDLIKHYQKLFKQSKYTKKKDILAFIKGTIYRLQKEYTKAEKYYKISIDLDKDLAYPYNGLGIIYFEQENYSEAEKYCWLSIDKDKDFTSPYNVLGAIYGAQEKYDEAEKYYKLSIEKDKDYTYPYCNLGMLYERQKKYDDAEKYYKLSFEISNDYASPYYKLGALYEKQEKYDDAEKNYKLSIEKDRDYASPYNSLGILYKKQKNYSEAEKYFKLASKADNTWGGYHYNLALVYMAIQDFEKAKVEYKKALDLYTSENDEYGISSTERSISDLKTKIKSQEILDDKTVVSIKDTKIKNILKSIKEKKIDKQIEDNKEKYFEFLKIPEEGNHSTEDAYFEVLRRWNSYTPIVANSFHSSKGGGYFIKIGTKGIVIDPGFNFIDNFRSSGYKFNELTTVLISHAHNDHTSDLESILTLLYKYNKNLKKKLPDILAKNREEKIEDIKDDLIEKEYNKRRKVVDFFVTKSVFMKYSGLFELHSKNDYIIHIIEKDQSYRIITNFWFYTIDAKHDDIISDRDAVGFLFNFNDVSLIYSGDSGWSKKIEQKYNNLIKNRTKDYIVLLAHIGGFKKSEMDYLNYKGKEREKCLYKNHLGRIGLCRMNETVKPNICLISEFGEEFTNHRIDMAEIYQSEFKDEIIFTPADIGLKFDFGKKQFYAVTVTDLNNKKLEYGYVKPEELISYLFKTDYSLHYYKKDSNCSWDRLEDILKYNFDENNKQ